jgi:hypothetical protein
MLCCSSQLSTSLWLVLLPWLLPTRLLRLRALAREDSVRDVLDARNGLASSNQLDDVCKRCGIWSRRLRWVGGGGQGFALGRRGGQRLHAGRLGRRAAMGVTVGLVGVEVDGCVELSAPSQPRWLQGACDTHLA